MSMRTLLAYIALFCCPFFFSSNAIFGRLAQDIEPFTLAFLRWSLTGVILAMVSLRHWPQLSSAWRQNWRLFLALGWLGMWLAGGIVYMALRETTATNGLLIYTLPPALVILIEYFIKGRRSHPREWIGIVMAVFGVLWIMLEGNMSRLAALAFNPGDLLFLAAAIGWSFYTLLLRQEPIADLPTAGLLSLVALTGSMVLFPFMLWELWDPTALAFPSRLDQWGLVAGVVFSASIGAFILYNFGVKVLGPSLASIFMYLLAPVGIFEAWLFLGEVMGLHHWIGAGFVLGGVILATVPLTLFRSHNAN